MAQEECEMVSYDTLIDGCPQPGIVGSGVFTVNWMWQRVYTNSLLWSCSLYIHAFVHKYIMLLYFYLCVRTSNDTSLHSTGA